MESLFRIFFVLILVVNSAFAQYSSPSGMVISHSEGEKNRTWYFCPNGNVQLIEDVWPEKSVFQGKWEMNGAELQVDLTLHYGKRGIGQSWVSESSAKGFNEYMDFVHIVKNEYKFDWETLLVNNGSYKLVKENYNCTSNFYSPQLPGEYPIASYRVLNNDDLKGMSADELYKMRSEILARYGQKFANSTIREYYQNKAWYFPEKESVEHYLTNIEKRNMHIIAAAERRANR